MAAKIPVLEGETTTCSIMAWGFNPYLSRAKPLPRRAMLAVVESVAKAGGRRAAPADSAWLTFQEYFEQHEPATRSAGASPWPPCWARSRRRWTWASAAIGGKDSMSGSFEDIHVPPTLISFAVTVESAAPRCFARVQAGGTPGGACCVPRPMPTACRLARSLLKNFETVAELLHSGCACAAYTPGLWRGGRGRDENGLWQQPRPCLRQGRFASRFVLLCLRRLCARACRRDGAGRPSPGRCHAAARSHLWGRDGGALRAAAHLGGQAGPPLPEKRGHGAADRCRPSPSAGAAQSALPPCSPKSPRFLIPVFPGTNCEYDTAKRRRACRRRKADIFVIRNLTAADISESIDAFAAAMRQSQRSCHAPAAFRAATSPTARPSLSPPSSATPASTRRSTDLLRAARRPDVRHLQRLPGPHQAGAGSLRRRLSTPTRAAPR